MRINKATWRKIWLGKNYTYFINTTIIYTNARYRFFLLCRLPYFFYKYFSTLFLWLSITVCYLHLIKHDVNFLVCYYTYYLFQINSMPLREKLRHFSWRDFGVKPIEKIKMSLTFLTVLEIIHVFFWKFEFKNIDFFVGKILIWCSIEHFIKWQ